MDKKFLGGIVKNEYTHKDIISLEQAENLLYSVLKVNTRGGTVEFKLHNKGDGRTFCDTVNSQVREPERTAGHQPVQPQSFYQNIQNSVPQNIPNNAPKGSSEDIFEQLEKLGKLRQMGILSEEEFTEQKKNC
jgi:hypothetical protein